MDQEIDQFLSDNKYFTDYLSPTSSSKIFKVIVSFDFEQSHQYQLLYNQLISQPITTLKSIQIKLSFKLRCTERIPRYAYALLIFLPINLPMIESCITNNNSDLYLRSGLKVNRLVKVKDCQIISLAEINVFKLATIYQCKCKKRLFYNYLLDGLPKKLVKCDCSNSMEEIISERVVVKRRTVLLKKKADRQGRLTPIQVNFMSTNEEDYNKLRLGSNVNQIDGLTYRYKVGYGHWIIGLEALNYQIKSHIQPISDQLDLTILPDRLNAIVGSSKEFSQFSAALRLCDLFAEQIVADGQFTLKMGILISLLNQYGNESQEKSFLAIGEDSGIIRSFLEYSAKFAESVLSYSVAIPISAVPRKKEHWIDSGFLQLASDGVGIISLEKVSVKDESHLISVLTQNRVKIKVPDEKYDAVREMEVNISIWGYETEENISRRIKTKSSALLPAFALVYQAENCPLDQGASELTAEEWKFYFEAMKHYKPILVNEAKDFLENYFLAARQDREWRVNINSFSTLISIATTFAKLSCRTHVLKCDAILAIIIYEKSLFIKFGASGLSLPDLTKDRVKLMGPEANSTLANYEKQIISYFQNCGFGGDKGGDNLEE